VKTFHQLRRVCVPKADRPFFLNSDFVGQNHTVGSRSGRTASLSMMDDEMKADALSAAVPCCSRNGRSWSLSERLNGISPVA
jgi:hypothetical protein